MFIMETKLPQSLGIIENALLRNESSICFGIARLEWHRESVRAVGGHEKQENDHNTEFANAADK
jgi:hypothetical protein